MARLIESNSEYSVHYVQVDLNYIAARRFNQLTWVRSTRYTSMRKHHPGHIETHLGQSASWGRIWRRDQGLGATLPLPPFLVNPRHTTAVADFPAGKRDAVIDKNVPEGAQNLISKTHQEKKIARIVSDISTHDVARFHYLDGIPDHMYCTCKY